MFETSNSINSNGKLLGIPEKTRTYFLLLFTKELIRNSTQDFHKLEHTIKKKGTQLIKKKETKKHHHKKHKPKDPFMLSLMHRFPQPKFVNDLVGPAPPIFKNMPTPLITPPQQNVLRRPPFQPPLSIQHPPLPPNLQYLTPIPTNVEIHLGKLEPLGEDPNIRSIECNGPDEIIYVRGNMGRKPTNFTLNRDEIDELLGVFSEASKIPLHEGVFKIVVGKYILSAIISSFVGSKFIINKMQQKFTPSAPLIY